MVSGSLSLPSRGSFHLSLTVLCAIGSRRVFCLGGWSPLLPPGFLVSRRTQDRRQAFGSRFAYGAFTLSGRPSQAVPLASPSSRSPRRRPTTPHGSLHPVWAPPRSLAATGGISFDFYSCGYLDGSLPRVFPLHAIHSHAGAGHPGRRVTPFGDHPWIVGRWHLPTAFRSCPRPSSPGGSQASSMNPSSLDHIILSVPAL